MLEHVHLRGIAVLFYLTHAAALDGDLTLILDVEKPIAVTSDKFLSLTLDPAVLASSNAFNSSNNKRITNLGKALSPAYFRLAGINDNSSIFHLSGEKSVLHPESGYSLINDWAKTVDLNIIISIPPVTNHTKKGIWDFESIEKFIRFNDNAGYNISFQLGYECLSRCNVPAEDLGKDVVRLRELLSALPRYSNSVIAGPDVVTENAKRQQSSLQDYLNTTQTVLSAITWHPDLAGITLSGVTVTVEYDKLESDKKDLFNIIGPWTSNKEFWIAESKREFGKNDYFGAIIWTRRLGLAAKLGAHVIMRRLESSLIFKPTPDYWVSVLHKMLVGREALNIEIADGTRAHVQFYCQCTKPSERYEKGSVTIFGFNVALGKVTANLKSTLIKTLHAYVLSPGNDSPSKMFAETVLLNGQPLSLLNSTDLPDINPLIYQNDTGVIMQLPPLGIGFWVIPDMKVDACLGRLKSKSSKNVIRQNGKSINSTRTSETKASVDNRDKLNGTKKSDLLEVKTGAQSKQNLERLSEEEIRVKLEEYKQRISEYARGKKVAQGTTPEKASQYETTSATALISKVAESDKLANASVANLNQHKTASAHSRLKRGIDDKSWVPKKYEVAYSTWLLHTDVTKANATNKAARRARRADDNLHEANLQEHVRDQKRDTNIMKISQANASSDLSSLLPHLKSLFQSQTEQVDSDEATSVQTQTQLPNQDEDGSGSGANEKDQENLFGPFMRDKIENDDEEQTNKQIEEAEEFIKAEETTTLESNIKEIELNDDLVTGLLESTTNRMLPITSSILTLPTEISKVHQTLTTDSPTEIKSHPQSETTEKMMQIDSKQTNQTDSPKINSLVTKEIFVSSTVLPHVSVEEATNISKHSQIQREEIVTSSTTETSSDLQNQKIPSKEPKTVPINSEPNFEFNLKVIPLSDQPITPSITNSKYRNPSSRLTRKSKEKKKKSIDVEQLKSKLRQKRTQLFLECVKEFLKATANFDPPKREFDNKFEQILGKLIKIERLLSRLDRYHRQRRSVTLNNSKVGQDWSTAEQKIVKKDLGSLFYGNLLLSRENRQNNVADGIQTMNLPAEFMDYLHTNGLNEQVRRVKRQDSMVDEKIRSQNTEMKAEEAMVEFLQEVLEVFESSRKQPKQTRVTTNDENNEKSHPLNGITSRLFDALPKVQQVVNNAKFQVQDNVESLEKIVNEFVQRKHHDQIVSNSNR